MWTTRRIPISVRLPQGMAVSRISDLAPEGSLRLEVAPVFPAGDARVAELREMCALLRECLGSRNEVQKRLAETVASSAGGKAAV
jgi:hypothetical protein